MNNRFKFRAWLSTTKKMLYLDKFIDKDLEEEEFWKVMQCTGLRDKNGKEIYEGDVLRWWVDTTEKFAKELLEVRWEGIGFTLFSKLFKGFGVPEGSTCLSEQARKYMMHSEVIGNIYENPELLHQDSTTNF